jgi:quinol-cytochrome oxidoreductase complex cytochrome b subunit
VGVLAMVTSILLLFFLPWLDKSPVRSGSYRSLFQRFFEGRSTATSPKAERGN